MLWYKIEKIRLTSAKNCSIAQRKSQDVKRFEDEITRATSIKWNLPFAAAIDAVNATYSAFLCVMWPTDGFCVRVQKRYSGGEKPQLSLNVCVCVQSICVYGSGWFTREIYQELFGDGRKKSNGEDAQCTINRCAKVKQQ